MVHEFLPASPLPETLARHAADSLGSPDVAFDVLRRYLDECEIASKRVAQYTLAFVISYGERRIECMAGISSEPPLLVFYAYYDQVVIDERRAALGEFVLRANHDLPVGSFELLPDEGPLRYKSSLAIGALEMSTVLVCSVLEPALTLFLQHIPALDAVLCFEDPAAVVAAIRTEHG
ncbi:MAG: YbjN domain-containing protein [Deltaproteobacteria bacterium]|nr:YbjN domain-containing protein [Deltaproteobacteria bacterium]